MIRRKGELSFAFRHNLIVNFEWHDSQDLTNLEPDAKVQGYIITYKGITYIFVSLKA